MIHIRYVYFSRQRSEGRASLPPAPRRRRPKDKPGRKPRLGIGQRRRGDGARTIAAINLPCSLLSAALVRVRQPVPVAFPRLRASQRLGRQPPYSSPRLRLVATPLAAASLRLRCG
jgi:hypothetical protein